MWLKMTEGATTSHSFLARLGQSQDTRAAPQDGAPTLLRSCDKKQPVWNKTPKVNDFQYSIVDYYNSYQQSRKQEKSEYFSKFPAFFYHFSPVFLVADLPAKSASLN